MVSCGDNNGEDFAGSVRVQHACAFAHFPLDQQKVLAPS
jgi:hypothetical protein